MASALRVPGRYKVRVESGFCKGCSICVDLCPVRVLELSKELNERGYHVPLLTGECVGCRVCEILCPDFAIYVDEAAPMGSVKALG